jgi:hypothetical protein
VEANRSADCLGRDSRPADCDDRRGVRDAGVGVWRCRRAAGRRFIVVALLFFRSTGPPVHRSTLIRRIDHDDCVGDHDVLDHQPFVDLLFERRRKRGRNRHCESDGVGLGAQLGELDRALFTILTAQRHALAKDVVGDDFLFADLRLDDFAFFRKPFAALHVEFVLVPQAAHEAPTRAGNLRRIERQSLVLGHAEVHGAELGQPRRRAILAAAAADAVEPLGFVANADLLQLDPRAEHRRELAHERTEVDALLGREVQRELLAIPLPFGIGELHRQLVGGDSLHGASSRVVVLLAQIGGAPDVVAAGEAPRFFGRPIVAVAVRRAGVSLLRQFAKRVHATEVLSPVGVDDHCRLERRRLVGLPEEEVLSISLERNLYEMRHESWWTGGQVDRWTGGPVRRSTVHSKYCPIRRNFSLRRRMSLSGLCRRRSSSWRTSVSCRFAAAAS